MRCLKNYIFAFREPNKIYTDKGLEFKNILFDNFCNDNNIEHVFLKPYSPQSHGEVKVSHNQIKNWNFTDFNVKLMKFSFSIYFIVSIEVP